MYNVDGCVGKGCQCNGDGKRCRCNGDVRNDVPKIVESLSWSGMVDELIHNGFQAGCWLDSSDKETGGSVDDDVVPSAKSATSLARSTWESQLCWKCLFFASTSSIVRLWKRDCMVCRV